MGRAILVVDGSSVAQAVLRSYLRKELMEAEVDIAATGEQALQLLEARQEPFGLITTALQLPDMDGLDLCLHIRQSRRHGRAPVVVVSSDADERLKRGGFQAGVTEYFDKSRGIEALGGFIKEFVQRSPGYVGRVLYVEDSRTASAWGCRAMVRQGLDVEHVTSAEMAMQRLNEADSGLPDLVVTDYFLSGKATGEDLLRYVRQECRCSPQELPVLVVTGNSHSGRHAEVLHRGANDFIEKPIIEEILIARIRSLLMVSQTFATMRRQSEAMRLMAFSDSLTGTRNKRYLLDFGEEFMADRKGSVVVLLNDIDHFKHINDTYGHLTGDRILEAIGRLLRGMFPESEGHLVARFGGEEFVTLLGATAPDEGLQAAEKFRHALSELHPEGIKVTTTVGVADTERHGTDLARLIAMADEALYQGKTAGRDRVHCALTEPLELV
ncbi:GGDEF domain-containing response regulator [Thiohalomonas denitrificans]|uniref:diguanylate cyclase n=1 Tax=Thiohalomonas denitrificans TaxID=415747 RepID=A0A1G5PR95_9GAMM|nr:diguanylate cyclase [Thiohalomonas denitrificans]SCZ52104.1 two-component system, cell cycle response regulator [Thiohalomonas denitrificans]